MSEKRVNENDLESPGCEYLRSYQSMSNLYYKLLTLNYRSEFCVRFKFSPIHRHYFSLTSKNPTQQQFLFTCLCAWLIKDKCQMNLDLEPEEYEDPDYTIGIILEALRLLLIPEDGSRPRQDPIKFPPGRLRQGFGPELIWTLNILADRALELMVESQPDMSKIEIVYSSKAGSDSSRLSSANSITIGQPIVGGGLTTRPLGSYQINDSSLLFDAEDDCDDHMSVQTLGGPLNDVDPDDWCRRVDRASAMLDANRVYDNETKFTNWLDLLDVVRNLSESVEKFGAQAAPTLEAIASKVGRQMQIITNREDSLQTNLKVELDKFLEVWRDYNAKHNENIRLIKQVDGQTDQFEGHSEALRDIKNSIETRIKELNDGSALRELELLIEEISKESEEFHVKIGLLLTVYPELHKKVVSPRAARL